MSWRLLIRVGFGVAVAALAFAPPAVAVRQGDDFRISRAGGLGSTAANAGSPKIAHNSVNDEALVVWDADDTEVQGVADNEQEIFAQRLDHEGDPLGPSIRVSSMGTDGNATTDGTQPDVVHNPLTNEYLVVWEGSDPDAGLAAGESEVFGQRLSATGQEVGADDFRISDAGGIGNFSAGVENPSVAFSPAANEFLVVWQADDTDSAGVVDNEREIYAQRLSAQGVDVGTNDFRVSDAGGIGNAVANATDPDVVFNPDGSSYLVVWRADDTDAAGVVDSEFEIFGQRLSAGGSAQGANDFRISDAGGTGITGRQASSPAVGIVGGGFLGAISFVTVWEADDTDVAGVANDEFEIYAEYLDTAGTSFLSDLSDLGRRRHR